MDLTLAGALADDVFRLLLVLVRIGSALMVVPALGDAYVPMRVRLLLALLIAFLITPAVTPVLPTMPASNLALIVLIAGEAIVGLFLGLVARLLMTALEIAGMAISFNLSLANAFVFNPMMAAQGSLVGAFLGIMGMVLIFATDLHHLMLFAIVDSYDLFIPGEMPMTADMADMMAHLLSRAFTIGVRLAAPFIVIGLVFYLGLGVLARLMPQIPVLFVAMPAQILLGFIVFALVVSATMMYWLGTFQEGLIVYMRP